MASGLVERSSLAIATSERIMARFRKVTKPEPVVAISVVEKPTPVVKGPVKEWDQSLDWNIRRLAEHSRRRSAKKKR